MLNNAISVIRRHSSISRQCPYLCFRDTLMRTDSQCLPFAQNAAIPQTLLGMKNFSAARVRERCGNVAEQCALQRSAFINFHRGTAVMGPRAVIAGGTVNNSSAAGSQSDNVHFSYLARASPSGPAVVKFGSVVPSNAGRNLPVVSAYLFSLHPETGHLAASFDGETVTEIRTAAASIAAALELADRVFGGCRNVKHIAVIGSGVQGRAHARAALAMFPALFSLTMCSPRADTLSVAAVFGDGDNGNGTAEMAARVVRFSSDSAAARAAADIIFLCTNTSTPIAESFLQPAGESPEGADTTAAKRTIVVSVGSFAPDRSEVPVADLLRADLIAVDDAETCVAQCGSVVQALAAAEQKQQIVERIRAIGSLFDEPPETKKPLQSALYFTVGLGIQDAVVAEFLLASNE